MLNVGFIDEPHRPEDIRDIGKCLTYLHEHQGEKDLFGNPLSNVSVSAMLVSIHQKNIAQAFILERYFFVSIYPAVIPGTYLMVFLVVALLLCLLHQIYIQRS